MRRMAKHALTLTLTAALVGHSASVAVGASPLAFSFTKAQSLLDLEAGTPAQQALAANLFAGFQAAGEVWRSVLKDPATLNFVIEVDGLPPGAGGQAIPEFVTFNYSSVVRPAMIADGTSVDDLVAAGSLPLPLASGIEFMTNDTTTIPAPRIRDSDGTANNTELILTRANAKALGLVPAGDPANDGTLRILSNAPWDFDLSDGLGANQIDFVGVAVHELGHQLGFFSGVEILDLFVGDGVEPEGPLAQDMFDLNGEPLYFPWDLFRYTADSLSQPNQPHGGLRDWSVGTPSVGDTPFFSIDGGATALATFSTGAFNGDGFGPSHWQDDLDHGNLDPTLDLNPRPLTALDIQAFDVMGWDLLAVPEPASIALLVLAVAPIASRTR